MPSRDTSIDTLIASVRSFLQEASESAKPPIKAGLPTVSFWLEKRNFLEAIEEQVQITDIGEVQPDSRVIIQLEFMMSDIVYRLIIRTYVNENGVFQLTHPELDNVDFPYSDEGAWEAAKAYAKEHAYALAGLTLSMINLALNIMRLGHS